MEIVINYKTILVAITIVVIIAFYMSLLEDVLHPHELPTTLDKINESTQPNVTGVATKLTAHPKGKDGI